MREKHAKKKEGGVSFTRRGFVGLAAGPWLITRSSAGSTQQAKTNGIPPNILLIMADQMTPFMTGPYGQRVARTPNLDRLARNGTVLENAYCNSPLCVPSRTAGCCSKQIGRAHV